MNKSAIRHARVEPQTKKADGVPIPNGLTSKILEKSQKGAGVEVFDTLEEIFES